MFSEDDLLPISALQHLLFCERQCALIHIERLWAENRLTVEGQHLHKKAHAAGDELREGVRIVRSLRLRSLRYGLVGTADVVEFEALDGQSRSITEPSASGEGRSWMPGGTWRVTPIEYKRGRPKKDDSDRVQLCAQALCLEEALGVSISAGALFYGKRRRRTSVAFDARLRSRTIAAAERLHELITAGRTPLAEREPKCDNCSLIDLCLPDALKPGRVTAAFVTRQFQQHLASVGPEGDLFDDGEATP